MSDLVERLRARATAARSEGNATALGDAIHFEESVARIEELEGALQELVECARLRGDNDLPAPPDDPKLWTARMQEAWNEAERACEK